MLVEVVGDSARVITLEPEQSVRFGRGAEDVLVEVTFGDASVPRLAGEIRAVEDHWCLSNFSRAQTYVVENPEGSGEYVKIGPGRLGAPIPFEISRLMLPTGGTQVVMRVFAPQQARLDGPYRGAGDPTISAFPLDQAAKYFLVLVALCEPRLRDESAVAIPATAQVVERLRPLESCSDLTAEAVAFHIDYLVRAKLRIAAKAQGGGKREALVRLATRFDLVREEHLSLLPPRPHRPR